MGSPYVYPPSVPASFGAPPEIPQGQVWLFDGGRSWNDPHYVLDIANADPGQQYSFVGTSMENRSDWIAFNLPDGVVMTLLNNPTTPPDGEPYNFTGAGVCVDLFGNGQTQTVNLAGVSAVNCLSASIWRTPDLSTGVFQLFDAAFTANQEPSSSTVGPRNTFFLSEWPIGTVHSLDGWAICDAADAIYFTGLNAQSVVLYDGGNGDGARTGAFSGWFDTTWALLQTQGFTNRAASWNWTMLTPVMSTVDPVSIDVPASSGSLTGLSQYSSGVNHGDATLQQTANFTASDSQVLTTTTTFTVATATEISQTTSFTVKTGVIFASAEETYTIGIKFTETTTQSTAKTVSTTQTFSIANTLVINVPANSNWQANWVIQIGQIPTTSYTTTAHYFYEKPIPGTVPDPTMSATLGKTVYRLDATVTGIVQGSLAASSSTNVITTPITAT